MEIKCTSNKCPPRRGFANRIAFWVFTRLLGGRQLRGVTHCNSFIAVIETLLVSLQESGVGVPLVFRAPDVLSRPIPTPFPSPGEKQLQLAFLARPRCHTSCPRKPAGKPPGAARVGLAFSFLFLKMEIKAKGFRQYKCQSSCFSFYFIIKWFIPSN